jgi:apolipoprotein N-acyltransferase
MPFRTSLLHAAMHAAILAIAYPPVNLWPAAFLAPVPLVWLALRAGCTWRALAAVGVTQIILWLWMHRWIASVTILGYPVLALYLSLYAMLLVWVLRRMNSHPRLRRMPLLLTLPVVWVGLEFLRGRVAFDGYPWFLLGHPLVEWPVLVQSADLFGAYFASFMAAVAAGAVVDSLRRWRNAREAPGARAISGRRRAMLVAAPLFVAGLVHASNLAYGARRMWEPPAGGEEARQRIIAIQTNLPQDNKIGWSVEDQSRDLPEFIELTRRAVAACGGSAAIDLVVWPETMVPGLGFDPETLDHVHAFGPDFEHLSRWPEAVTQLAAELGIPMLVGSSAWVETRVVAEGEGRSRLEREHEYNSAFLIQPSDPPQRYDKVFLTPFGETMPYISRWPWLEERLLSLGAPGMTFALDASPEPAPLRLRARASRGGGVPATDEPLVLGTPICFEDAVGWTCRELVWGEGNGNGGKRCHLLVNLSNDGWFGGDDGGRAQHAQIARFRCIENRVPMVRAANTGLSVWIDSRGLLVGTIGSGRYGHARQAGWLQADPVIDCRSTLYGRIGDAWAWLCLTASVGLVGLTIACPCKEARQ